MTRPVGSDLTPRVVGRTDLGDIVVLELAARAGRRLARWAPGAHIDVVAPNGLVRQYSLIGDPEAATWRIAVLRESRGRGGSQSVHTVQVGDLLGIGGPHNHFRFDPDDATVIFLAGGVGITPISAMAALAARAGVDYQVHYAGRPGRMVLVDELRELHGDRLHLHRTAVDARLDVAAVLGAAAPGTAVYCCGPARLIDEAESVAAQLGLDFHAERFEAIPLRPPVRTEPFEVELELSGITLEVPPDRSILEVVEDAGLPILWSCTEGTCGTCETPVLDGEVDHRDSILSPAQRARNDTMFICVSRAAGPRLVLEL